MIFDNNTKSINGNEDTTKSINNIRLVFSNIEIPKVKYTKFLGIWIDKKLDWKTHLTKIMAEIKTKICMLQKGKALLTTQRLQDKLVQLISPYTDLPRIYKQHNILQVHQLITLENIKLWHKHTRETVTNKTTGKHEP